MRFCAFDLEGTGLEPQKDAIIEVGAVVFELDAFGKLKFGKSFSQLVKPEIAVPDFIQKLTGISEAQLQSEPSWEQVRPRLEEFIGKQVIVGQNIQFDLNFLSAHGLPLPQGAVDTKELAQMFLPQANFFNLEFLLRHFGLPMPVHHRALDDAKSAAILLRQLLVTFHEFPLGVQQQIAKLLKASQLVYKTLFLPKPAAQQKTTRLKQGLLFEQAPAVEDLPPPHLPEEVKTLFQHQGVVVVKVPLAAFNSATQRMLIAAENLRQEGLVLSLGHQTELEHLKKAADITGFLIADQPGHYFCDYYFQELLKQPSLPDSVVRFIVKVLVWQQQKSPEQDFFLPSLSGEEFLFAELVSGDLQYCSKHPTSCSLKAVVRQFSQNTKVLTTHSAWLKYVKNGLSKKFRRGLFWDVSSLEQALESSESRFCSWKALRLLLTLLFDPQAKTGLLVSSELSLRKAVEQLLNTLDLQLGLFNIYFSDEEGFRSGQRIIDEEFRDSEIFVKMKSGAQKLVDQLGKLNKKLSEAKLDPLREKIVLKLRECGGFLDEFFFVPRAEKIYWFEFYSGQFKLKSQPTAISLQTAGNFDTQFLCGAFSTPEVQKYFERVFALPAYSEVILPGAKPAVEVYLPETSEGTGAGLLQQENAKVTLLKILPELSGRSLVLFNSQKNLEAVYQAALKSGFSFLLLAQRLTGHQWKNLERYRDNNQAVWFLTVQNFIKGSDLFPQVTSLIMVRVPFVPPQISEVTYDPEEVFEQYVIPKSILKLEKIVCRFINSSETPSLKKIGKRTIFFLDPRINQGYCQPLLACLKSQLTVKILELLKGFSVDSNRP